MSIDDRKRYLILKEPSILKGIIILAIPIMFNNLIKTLHDVVDMFFVSKITSFGEEAVTSISITFPVVFMFIALGIGLSIAGTSLISQYIGAGQKNDAQKYATTLVVLALIIGIVLNFLSYFGAPYIMRLIDAEGYVLENSIKYLQIRAFELPLLFVFFAYQAIRNASGDTLSPMIIGVATILINIILSPIFIIVLNLGVSGAAYATLISHVVILPIVLLQLFKSTSGITIKEEYVIIDKVVAHDLLKTAAPAALGQSFTAIGFIVMTYFILSYGTPTASAFAISNRISSMILHPAMAIGAILSAYIGQNIGNLNPERAKQAFRTALNLGVGVMATGSLIVLFFRRSLAGIFLLEGSYALDLAEEYMFFLLIGLPLMAVFQTFIGVYNGTGHTKLTFIIGVTRLWLLRIPLIMLFKYYTDFNSSGIWYAMLLSNLIIVVIGYMMYKTLDFKPKIRIE